MRKSATKPAAFGATESHATKGVDAASYVSGTHMWNGNAAILNANPRTPRACQEQKGLAGRERLRDARQVGRARGAVHE